MRNVKFSNQEGRAFITASSKGVIGKNLIYPTIQAEIEISVSKNIQVLPSSVLMYANRSNI